MFDQRLWCSMAALIEWNGRVTGMGIRIIIVNSITGSIITIEA